MLVEDFNAQRCLDLLNILIEIKDVCQKLIERLRNNYQQNANKITVEKRKIFPESSQPIFAFGLSVPNDPRIGNLPVLPRHFDLRVWILIALHWRMRAEQVPAGFQEVIPGTDARPPVSPTSFGEMNFRMALPWSNASAIARSAMGDIFRSDHRFRRQPFCDVSVASTALRRFSAPNSLRYGRHYGVAELAVRLRIGNDDLQVIGKPHQASGLPWSQATRVLSRLWNQNL